MSRPIRRTQAIAPFGPGGMVDFPGASLVDPRRPGCLAIR